jgi:hypothetical protein
MRNVLGMSSPSVIEPDRAGSTITRHRPPAICDTPSMSPSRRHEIIAWAVPRMRGGRAAEAGWDLRCVERPGLIHVYPLLPVIPEAKDAWRQTREFLG